eukprot:TRINITY_DN5188_c0_g1_i2.p1 TRINITY_DN5188_c0_g1~~TRINITY_DN5188_c0_g1_i2.p1  ORF type:complete len:213 (+),score=55.38 TRINITY_DN5188_c0_g1_i2:338-976(+)
MQTEIIDYRRSYGNLHPIFIEIMGKLQTPIDLISPLLTMLRKIARAGKKMDSFVGDEAQKVLDMFQETVEGLQSAHDGVSLWLDKDGVCVSGFSDVEVWSGSRLNEQNLVKWWADLVHRINELMEGVIQLAKVDQSGQSSSGKEQEQEEEEEEASESQEVVDENQHAVAALARVREKLESDESVEDQVSRLIREATDEGRLCRMFEGWSGWV